VPSNPTNGYRIEFFKNTNLETYGEGEVYLGSVDVAHGGGDLNFTGSITTNASVNTGDYISATTTRKTGSSSFDITSEFSLTYASQSTTTQLVASETVTVFDPTSLGLYAIPGNDVISSLTMTNTGDGTTDNDSIVVIKNIASETIFYNADIDDGGPETDPVAFTQSSGAGLSFNYAADVKYSNGSTPPADMSECDYEPATGYDVNVRFVCINPKGGMAPGDPDPTVTLSYRMRIQ